MILFGHNMSVAHIDKEKNCEKIVSWTKKSWTKKSWTVSNREFSVSSLHMNELIWNINAHHFEMQAYFCRCVANNDFFACEALKMAIAILTHALQVSCVRHSTQSQKILWETLE